MSDPTDDSNFGVPRRVPIAELPDTEAIRGAIRAAMFDPAMESAVRAGHERELHAEIWRPLHEIIGADEAAVGAAKNLGKLRRTSVSRAASDRKRDAALPASEISRFDLPPGTSVFTPPYDSKDANTSGSPIEATPDADHGQISLLMPDDSEAHGARVASASVAMALEPSIKGTIKVRPWIEYAFWWRISGNFLSAYCEGRIDIAVVRDDGQNAAPPIRVPLWSRATESYDSDSGSDIVRPPARDVSFVADPGRIYMVSFGATMSGDQSGDVGVPVPPLFLSGSYSHSAAGIDMTVPWLAAELRR
jgi:hypothetical protein